MRTRAGYAAGMSGQASQAVSQASREELLELARLYLDALEDRQPSRAPLAASVRYTENGQQLPLGSGIWATEGGPMTYRLFFADPVQGQVGAFAVVPENDFPAIICVRLKVEDVAVVEVETIVARAGAPLFEPESLAQPNPLIFGPVEPSERSSREELITIAEGYWNAIEECGRPGGLTVLPAVHADCLRVENGHTATGHLTLDELVSMGDAARAEGFFAVRRLRIVDQLVAGAFGYITTVRDRRYPIVDEERGLVFSIAMFNSSGSMRGFELPGLGWIDLLPAAQLPVSPLIGELFKVAGGQIRAIEVVLSWFPYGMPSGW